VPLKKSVNKLFNEFGERPAIEKLIEGQLRRKAESRRSLPEIKSDCASRPAWRAPTTFSV
jgi:hypothetical protein